MSGTKTYSPVPVFSMYKSYSKKIYQELNFYAVREDSASNSWMAPRMLFVMHTDKVMLKPTTTTSCCSVQKGFGVTDLWTVTLALPGILVMGSFNFYSALIHFRHRVLNHFCVNFPKTTRQSPTFQCPTTRLRVADVRIACVLIPRKRTTTSRTVLSLLFPHLRITLLISKMYLWQ